MSLNDWNKYPYTNFHELNLDWIISQIKLMEESIKNFVNINTIKYANPISWNITSQYEGNTVVIDEQTGNAYISVKAVPSGVALSDTEYWTEIFNYATKLDELEEQIAIANEKQSITATSPRSIDDLVWLNGQLYKVISPMIAGDSYVVDSNVIKTTIEDVIKNEISARILNEATLKKNIDNEVQARINAVSAEEQARISGIDAEIQDRISGDTLLQQNIDDEEQARINAVSAEEQARINAVSAEEQARINAVSAEEQARINADSVINASINALQLSTVKNLKNRKFLFIGDSYGDEDNEWATLVPTYLKLNNSQWDNLCVNGAGFLSNGSLLFIDQIKNYGGDRNSITDIVVCGGLNDSNSTNINDTWWGNVREKMVDFANYARSQYPNANVSLGYIGNGIDHETTSLIGTRVYEARQLCKYYYNEIGSSIGFNILHDVDLALCTALGNMSSDGVHPSVYGSEAIAKAIAQALQNGYATIIYPLFDQVIESPYGGNVKLPYDITQDTCTIHLKNFDIEVPKDSVLPNNITFANSMTRTYFNKSFIIDVMVRLSGFDNKQYQYIPGTLQFVDKRGVLELTSVDSSGNFRTQYTATSNGYIHLNDIDILIPTKYLA